MKTTTAHQFYYRPLRHYNGLILKCAGCGAELPEHRAFYEPWFSQNADADRRFLPGVVILEGCRGDRIRLDDLTEFRGM